MQLNITGHHVELTDPLREYVNSKLEKLDRHSNDITSIHVTLTVDDHEQKAEANVHVSGAQLFANASCADMYSAIDKLSDKMDRQLIKHKEKVHSHR